MSNNLASLSHMPWPPGWARRETAPLFGIISHTHLDFPLQGVARTVWWLLQTTLYVHCTTPQRQRVNHTSHAGTVCTCPQPQLTGEKVAIKRISRVFADLVDGAFPVLRWVPGALHFQLLLSAKRILRETKLLSHFGKHENIIEVVDIMTGPPDTQDFHTLYPWAW